MALAIKKDPNAVEILSWRYNLRTPQVLSWLSETDWNYDGKLYHETFDKVVNYLLKLNLINSNEAQNWQEKLFSTQDSEF